MLRDGLGLEGIKRRWQSRAASTALAQRFLIQVIQPLGFVVAEVLLGHGDQGSSRLPGDAEIFDLEGVDEGSCHFCGAVVFEGLNGGDADVFVFVGVVDGFDQGADGHGVGDVGERFGGLQADALVGIGEGLDENWGGGRVA